MTDILLTHGYFLHEDAKELEIMRPYPPLGLLYISAYLRRRGFDVGLFDTTFARREDLYATLQRAPGGVLGLYTNLMTRKTLLDIVRVARDHGWTVVLGGPESANYPDEYLRRGADEVEHIKAAYQPDQVWYADDVFTIHHGWLLKFAAELKRRHLKLPFETISRADRMMREDILATLAEMGCYRIWIGSESGSQRILDAMERGVTAEQVQWVTKAAQRHGIQVGMFLMWGYEGEEIEDIAATIEHVKRCNPDVFFTTVAYPIMNTAYYKTVADRVLLKGDWADSTDREYAIQGRHSRTYYKYADQWLRNEVAAFRLESEDPTAALQKRHEAEQAQQAMLGAAAEVEA
jgi:radical SAM superfamily enzyme YgiQ (UPF0313 family)